MFLRSPQSFKQKRRSNEDLEIVRKKALHNNIKILIHANYMLNFCNPTLHKKACKVLIEDLEDSIKLNAIGVVVHMGHNTKKLKITNEEAINNYVNGIKNVLKNSPKNSVIVFETGAGQGNETCTDIIELGNLRKRFTKDEQKRIKFCIDTCHVFSAGYNLGDKNYVKVFDMLIENYLGWDNVVAIHLNDSKQPLDCHKDRHEDIGKGYINFDGLIEFVKICVKNNVPMILETPKSQISHIEQMKMIRDAVKKT